MLYLLNINVILTKHVLYSLDIDVKLSDREMDRKGQRGRCSYLTASGTGLACDEVRKRMPARQVAITMRICFSMAVAAATTDISHFSHV